MVRKGGRVKIQRIIDEKKRKATLRKRLPIVLKKAMELATLCDIPVSIIAYRPGEARPVVWPSPEVASDILRQHRDLPDLERFKKNLDSPEFHEQMNEKVRVKLYNVQRQNRDDEIIKRVLANFLAGHRKSFDDVPIDIVTSVGSRVQGRLQAVKTRLQELRSAAASALLPPAPVDVQPRNGSYTLPTTEEMHALFVQAGIFSPPP